LTRDLQIARSHHLTAASSRIAEQCDRFSLPGGAPHAVLRIAEFGMTNRNTEIRKTDPEISAADLK
jgi:hypothetical protein